MTVLLSSVTGGGTTAAGFADSVWIVSLWCSVRVVVVGHPDNIPSTTAAVAKRFSAYMTSLLQLGCRHSPSPPVQHNPGDNGRAGSGNSILDSVNHLLRLLLALADGVVE